MGNGWKKDKKEVKCAISHLVQEPLDAVSLRGKLCVDGYVYACACVRLKGNLLEKLK